MMQMNIVGSLKEGSRGSTMGSAHGRLRAVLVASEVAFSLVLMAGAGLLLDSFWNLSRLDPGFEPKQVVVANLWLPRPNDPAQFKYGKPETRRNFMREALRRVKHAAGSGGRGVRHRKHDAADRIQQGAIPAGRVNAPLGERPVAQTTSVTPEFFRALGVRLVRGRAFSESDDGRQRRWRSPTRRWRGASGRDRTRSESGSGSDRGRSG